MLYRNISKKNVGLMEYIKMEITNFFYKGYIIDLEISEKEG